MPFACSESSGRSSPTSCSSGNNSDYTDSPSSWYDLDWTEPSSEDFHSPPLDAAQDPYSFSNVVEDAAAYLEAPTTFESGQDVIWQEASILDAEPAGPSVPMDFSVAASWSDEAPAAMLDSGVHAPAGVDRIDDTRSRCNLVAFEDALIGARLGRLGMVSSIPSHVGPQSVPLPPSHPQALRPSGCQCWCRCR